MKFNTIYFDIFQTSAINIVFFIILSHNIASKPIAYIMCYNTDDRPSVWAKLNLQLISRTI